MASDPAQALSAGRVGRPHGLDGSFYVTRPRPGVFVNGIAVTVDGRATTLRRCAGTPDKPILALEGVFHRSDVEALRGQDLWVDRSLLPPLGEDEWWAEDLEGCTVVDGPIEVGTVRALLELPSCEVLEVDRPGADDLLVPLVQDAIRSIDAAARRIEVDLTFLGEAPGADPEEGN
jgi:16S rRNA processing protein RimM